MALHARHLSAPSPHDSLIATADGQNLEVHDSLTRQVVFSAPIDSSLAANYKILRFYRTPQRLSRSLAIENLSHTRPTVLIASDTDVQVFDISGNNRHASIFSACSPTSRIAHVGHISEEEVFIFTDFNIKATIWNIRTGLGTEIRDPKTQRGNSGYSVRPNTGHLAVLTRVGVKDTIVILGPEKRDVEASFSLESQDAQGVRWSGNGQWLVVWDTPGMGSALWIYTADGQLYRSWIGQDSQNKMSLGIKLCEWVSRGNWLFAGTGDGKVVGLGGKNFSPQVTLLHPKSITSVPQDAKVYQEEISTSPTYSRNYALTPMPANPPEISAGAKSSTAPPSTGIIHLSPSPSGAYIASVSSTTPTTLWIHSLSPSLRTRTILIHHNTVKALDWHPTRPNMLLINCTNSQNESGEKSRQPGVQDNSGNGAGKHWIHIWAAELSAPIISPILAQQYNEIFDHKQTQQQQYSSTTSSSISSSATAISWVADPHLNSTHHSYEAAAAIAGRPPCILLSTIYGYTTQSVWHTDDPEIGHGSLFSLSDAINAGVDSIHVRPIMDGKPASAPAITGEGPEDAFDEGNSLLELSPVRFGGTGQLEGQETSLDVKEDDTFAFRKQADYGRRTEAAGTLRAKR